MWMVTFTQTTKMKTWFGECWNNSSLRIVKYEISLPHSKIPSKLVAYLNLEHRGRNRVGTRILECVGATQQE